METRGLWLSCYPTNSTGFYFKAFGVLGLKSGILSCASTSAKSFKQGGKG